MQTAYLSHTSDASIPAWEHLWGCHFLHQAEHGAMSAALYSTQYVASISNPWHAIHMHHAMPSLEQYRAPVQQANLHL